jgi:membrane protease YdiL (CAAX protease family)
MARDLRSPGQPVRTVQSDRRPRSPWIFFLLVFALAAPFLALGALAGQGLLKGLRVNLPFSVLAFLCPIGAALILVHREEGREGVKAFMKRLFDLKGGRSWAWVVPVVILLPIIYFTSYSIMRAMGIPLPQPSLRAIPIFLLLFFLAAFCEEAGWMGYAFEPLQARWGALGAALILGAVWGLIHIIPDLQGHHPWAWIAGQRLFSVALRVLIVWVYNNTGGSVLAAVLLHAMDNVSVFTLFPDNGGGRYVPAITAALTALTAFIVTILWGPRTLARLRFARAGTKRPRWCFPRESHRIEQ